MSNWCQLSILTDEVSQDLTEVIHFAHEFQLDGIELRSLFGKAFRDLTPADIKEIHRVVTDAGLRISGVATPVFKCRLGDAADTATHVEIFRRSVDAALELGCRVVRVFAFLRESHPATTDELQRAAEQFAPLLEIARQNNVICGIENEASCIVGSGTETAQFLSYLPAGPELGVVWDPCNVIYLDGQNDPVHDQFPLIANRVVHVHVKDAPRGPGGSAATECVEIGTGDIDFPAQFRALKSVGYNGWITLETHWRGAARLDAESQHLPAGYAFSQGAEPASRICMAHLQKMVAEA